MVVPDHRTRPMVAEADIDLQAAVRVRLEKTERHIGSIEKDRRCRDQFRTDHRKCGGDRPEPHRDGVVSLHPCRLHASVKREPADGDVIAGISIIDEKSRARLKRVRTRIPERMCLPARRGKGVVAAAAMQCRISLAVRFRTTIAAQFVVILGAGHAVRVGRFQNRSGIVEQA